MKLFESDEQRDEFIKTIHEQGKHLMELVNDILDFAKIRAGKMEFFVEQMDYVPLLKKLSTAWTIELVVRVRQAPDINCFRSSLFDM